LGFLPLNANARRLGAGRGFTNVRAGANA